MSTVGDRGRSGDGRTGPDDGPSAPPTREGTAHEGTAHEDSRHESTTYEDSIHKSAAHEGTAPEALDDAFDNDTLPAPPGATGTLLRSLLAPRRARVTLAAVLLLVQQAVIQAGPLLVAYAIDRAVPAFRADDHGPLIAVGVAYLVCAAAAGAFQYAFIVASARVNQEVLLELRGRIFRHAQALSVDFHERYTSGRLISRATTDVESLRELLNEGLQELLTVVLSFGAALGLASLLFEHVLGVESADSAFPLFAFIFLVALGIDYNIFLSTRIREEAARQGTRPGVLTGLSATGAVITSAGLVLAGTFAALATIPMVAFVEIGFAVALGVLLDTFIVRSVLVTSLFLDVGPKVWWPHALAREDARR